MKNVLRGLLLLGSFLLLLSEGYCWAAQSFSDRLITVTGESEVKVSPDEVILTLGIETSDLDLKMAKTQNDIRVKRTLALASRYGIASRHIQTSHLSIEPRYENNYERHNFIGFFVRKTIVVILKDIKNFEDFLSQVLEEDVNYVHGIQFRTTKLREFRDQARSLAIKAAYEKARSLAQELEQDVGEPHAIQELPSGWWSWYNHWWSDAGRHAMMSQNVVQNDGGPSLTDGAIALGQISVRAKVSVSFHLISHKGISDIQEQAPAVGVEFKADKNSGSEIETQKMGLPINIDEQSTNIMGEKDKIEEIKMLIPEEKSLVVETINDREEQKVKNDNISENKIRDEK